MRADGFQIDQPHGVIDGVAQEIELVLAAEFVDQQFRQIAFLAPADGGVGGNNFGGGIHVRRHVVVQFFIGPGKAPGLL